MRTAELAALMTKDMNCGIPVIGIAPALTRESTWEQFREVVGSSVPAQSGPEVVRRLLSVVDLRTCGGCGHLERMGRYCALLGRRLGLAEKRCHDLSVASRLHDIGKIGILDSILLKPGPLSAHERAVVEQHAEIGYRMLAGSGSEFLELAATIAWTHHERFDGRGYPRGLARDRIPLEGRIAGVADVFDALTSERVYRPAFTLPQAVEMVESGRGSHFDPEIVDLFLDSLPGPLAIRDEYRTGDLGSTRRCPRRSEAGTDTELGGALRESTPPDLPYGPQPCTARKAAAATSTTRAATARWRIVHLLS